MQENQLSKIIGWVESKNNPYAYRFEPFVYKKLSAPTPSQILILGNIVRVHQCTMESAKIIYSSSFTQYQLMGFNLYGSLGYVSSVFHLSANDSDQLSMFAKFVSANRIDFTIADLQNANTRSKFAAIYNGAPSYSDLIEQALHHFGWAE